MRFLSTAALAISALSSYVYAAPQATGDETSAPAPAPTSPPPTGGTNPNPISLPTTGSVCKAGEECTIVWEPTTEGTVDLRLRYGNSDNLDVIDIIASDIENSGSFTWTPDEDLAGGDTYAIEIIPEEGAPNYSPQFTLDSEGTGKSATTTTESESTTSTTTEESTTTATTEAETTTTAAVTTTSAANGTVTTTTGRPRPTSDDDEEEEDEDEAPNPNGENAANGLLSAQSPLALILCVGAALAYLS